LSAGQGYLPDPGAVRLQPAAARPVDPSPKGGGFRAVSAPAAIRKAAVMACHGEGGEGLAAPHTFKSAGSGVIHPPGIARQPPLKRSRVFSNVMGRPGQQPLCLAAERAGKLRRQRGGARQMLENRSFPSVLRDVCKKFIFHSRSFLGSPARAPCGGPQGWVNKTCG